jgi:hypothetical protein
MPNDAPKPRLKWEAEPTYSGPEGHLSPKVSAKAGPLECIVLDYDGEFHWFAETGSAHIEGYSPSLIEAQVAAESAASAWLREGIEALGGKVTPARPFTPDDVGVGCHVTVEAVTHKPEHGVVQSIIPGHSMDLLFDSSGFFGRVYFDNTRILDVKPAS